MDAATIVALVVGILAVIVPIVAGIVKWAMSARDEKIRSLENDYKEIQKKVHTLETNHAKAEISTEAFKKVIEASLESFKSGIMADMERAISKALRDNGK